ncbi:MAG: hypothetical protein EKK29_00500 [Hyphomicrobiales bacterium]|nr:MAG: hypothetical protein EKK29_00500 [Hyphomicrobiales bacterium]
MTFFTFEYSVPGEAPVLSERIDVPFASALWCHVEALALRFGARPGAFIHVRDDKGRAVIRAGVATALASIAQCRCGDCGLKAAAARGAQALDGPPPLSPCRGAGACTCKSIPPGEGA